MAEDFAGASATGSASDAPTLGSANPFATPAVGPQGTPTPWQQLIAANSQLGTGGAAPNPEAFAGAYVTGSAPITPAPAPPAPGTGTFAAQPDNPYQDVIAGTVGTSDAAFNQLFAEYTKGLATLSPSTSGQTTNQDIAKATDLGQSIGGSSVQGQNPAYAAPLNADAATWAQANNQGEQGVMAALGNVRQADEQMLGVSPYAGLLQALTSGATYRAETAPTAGAGPQGVVPAWLQNAYNNAITSYGLTAGAQGAQQVGAQGSQGPTDNTSPSTGQPAPGGTGGPG